MPRVLLTGFAAVPGPRRAGVQLRHVIRALTPMHTVDVLVMREGDQAYVERQGSVRVLRVPTQEADLRGQIQAFQRALKRQLDGAEYDVVHCRDSWSCLPVLEARSRHDFTAVYDLSRSPLGETTFDAELDAQYARDEEACLLAADLVLAPTPASVAALRRRGRPERVMLSPPGVDIDRFDWDEAPPSGRPRILYAGTLDPGRGVGVLVRAMATILKDTDAQLVLAGAMASQSQQFLEEWIRELGVTERVVLLGVVDHDQLPALYSSATVCVVPAAADLTPNPHVLYPTKLLEYMACRTAIVAPRRETVLQVVGPNEALLFEPADPVDLGRKILRVLSDAALRKSLAHSAYERVRRELTASAARRAIRSAYSVLADRFVTQSTHGADEGPKIEMLADDDFEATVFEEAPAPPPVHTGLVDTGLEKLAALDEALASLEHTSSTLVPRARAPSREVDETQERAPVAPAPNDSGVWSMPAPPPAAIADDWIVTNVARAIGPVEDLAEEGTPIEGVVAAAPPLSLVEVSFVAGEIDVPTPPLDHTPDPDTG
ncbi:MAG: glycosyltransferase family 4 protein [Kofleriaceae bacterium]|nr:glycosyltransferase family 4 protein [Kofleriaceae bacterium]